MSFIIGTIITNKSSLKLDKLHSVQLIIKIATKKISLMEAEAEKYYNQRNVNKIVYNDLLGYAICYYHPMVDRNLPFDRQPEERCDHKRHRILHRLENSEDEDFYQEIEAMVRRREREDADKELRKICQKIHELFADVEQVDFKDRDVLNFRVREQIKGKSADEICDILVKDVLSHSKAIYHPKAIDFHKKPFQPRGAHVTRTKKTPEQPKVFQKIEKVLNESLQSEIHHRKFVRALDKIQDDIMYLKRRCTEKIDFAYLKPINY